MATDLTPAGGSPAAKRIGDDLEWTFTFTTDAGAPASVAAEHVTVMVESPAYTVTSYTGGDIGVASGVVTYTTVPDTEGVWRARCVLADGSVKEADAGFVWVMGRGVGPTS